MIYSSWDIGRAGLKLLILDHFFAFLPPKNPKNQNFEKLEEADWDIIILHTCTKNHNHMMYDSWGVRRTKLFVILGHFLPFYPPNNPETQNFEKKKKEPGDIIILLSVPHM